MAITPLNLRIQTAVRKRGQLIIPNRSGNITPPTPTPPQNLTKPTITGAAAWGSLLVCSPGIWIGVPTPLITYQWLLDGVEIPGATNSTYTTLETQVGQDITCRVIGSNSEGADSEDTNAITVVEAVVPQPPVNTVAPLIIGDAAAGSLLVSDTGTWTGDAPITYSYQWYADATPIGGATNNNYTTHVSQVGQSITCQVTAQNTFGQATQASNAIVVTGVSTPTEDILDSLQPETDGMVLNFAGDAVLVRDTGTPGNVIDPEAPIDASGLLTYTAPSVKTITGSDGLLYQPTLGNLPLDHAADGTPLGVLVESAATNLVLNSRAMVTQGVTTTASTYVVSFYGTGSIALTGTHTATLVGTGENDRVFVAFTATAGTLTLTPSGSVDYVQCELDNGTGRPSSPIITGGSTVTRAKDNIHLDMANAPHNLDENSIMYRGQYPLPASDATVYMLTDGGNTNRAQLYSASPNFRYLVNSGGSSSVLSNFAPHEDTECIIAVGNKLDDFGVSLNGATTVPDTSGAMPLGTNTLRIGTNAAVSGSFLNGHIKYLKYLPRRITNTELESESS